MFIIVLVIVVLLQLISSSYSIKQISYGRHSTAHSIVLDYSKKENKEKLLKGQTFIVTGGNIGIGLATVKALAFAGARVILCSRDIKKGNEALKNEINKKDYGNYIVEDTSNIIVKELDLASFQSIKKFTKDIIKKEKKINCLILNAGIMALPKLILHPETNCELQMATNHIGHAAVIRLLLPKLKNDARIVILSSSAHRFGTKDIMKDLSYKQKLYLPWVAYGQSKV
jgi:NAD(P)-dependent dehydrogenase (short-subunit alcohol dehydrogenase family)